MYIMEAILENMILGLDSVVLDAKNSNWTSL